MVFIGYYYFNSTISRRMNTIRMYSQMLNQLGEYLRNNLYTSRLLLDSLINDYPHICDLRHISVRTRTTSFIVNTIHCEHPWC